MRWNGFSSTPGRRLPDCRRNGAGGQRGCRFANVTFSSSVCNAPSFSCKEASLAPSPSPGSPNTQGAIMASFATRRTFLQNAAASAALLGVGDLAFLKHIPTVSAADAKLDPKRVRLDAGIEPLVLLLEETPRDKLLEEVAGRIKKGLSYREVVTALFLAGVRNSGPTAATSFTRSW